MMQFSIDEMAGMVAELKSAKTRGSNIADVVQMLQDSDQLSVTILVDNSVPLIVDAVRLREFLIKEVIAYDHRIDRLLFKSGLKLK